MYFHRSSTGTRLEDTVASSSSHTAKNETHITGNQHGQHFRYHQTSQQRQQSEEEDEDESEKGRVYVPFSTDSSAHSVLSDGNITD